MENYPYRPLGYSPEPQQEPALHTAASETESRTPEQRVLPGSAAANSLPDSALHPEKPSPDISEHTEERAEREMTPPDRPVQRPAAAQAAQPAPAYRVQAAPYRTVKRRKKWGGIFAAALGGIAAGATLMGVIMHPAAVPAEPAQTQTLAEVIESYENTPETADAPAITGGDSVTVTNTNNPVPEIAEAAGQSVVSVMLYNRSYISGQEPVDQAIGGGSGFVVGEDLVITNHHVVSGANTVMVVTSDGRELPVEVLGSDPNREVALLRVPDLNLPALALAQEDPAVGEQVIAIGNPINDTLTGTVTVGYLSGTGREIDLNETGITTPMLQTDAAINPGNSGGPLLNMNGEVIGITTMKTVYAGYSSGGAIAAEGIGYAVPVSVAMESAEQILKEGSVPVPQKPGLGFTYQPVNAEDAKMWGVPQGAMVMEVTPGSPAERAGIRPYDVITFVDGTNLTDGEAIPDFSERNVGDQVQIRVWRAGRSTDIVCVLADLNTLG